MLIDWPVGYAVIIIGTWLPTTKTEYFLQTTDCVKQVKLIE